MAKDDFEIDWDNDDPFSGDLDFDMDFDMDPYAKKGFVGGLTSGFLSGLVDSTVGDSSKRIKTLRTILPNTFSTALDKLSFVTERASELAKEFREENYQTVKSLQNIAGTLGKKMEGKLSGIGEGLSNFSQKDFSDWERYAGSSDNFTARLERDQGNEESNYEIQSGLNNQSELFSALGDSLNQMNAVVGGNIQSAIQAGNSQLINIEGSMRDLVSYYRNVQAKMDQAKISLLAKSYVQDAKYYKFQEALGHAQMAELKKIVKGTFMSDFEKTSTMTATKAYMRNKLFSTVGRRVGGLTGMLQEKFSQSNRKSGYSAANAIITGVADLADMAGDGGLSKGLIGETLGKMIAEATVDQLPMMFTHGPGKKVIDKLMKMYPEQGKYIKGQVKQLSELGNIVSYASTSGVGVLNHLAENFQTMDEMKYIDYDDYVDQLPKGKKPIPKAIWTVMNAATNKAKGSINKMMMDATKSKGTQYSLKRRDVKDLTNPGIWKEINNVTLVEVIPGLISRTNQLLEMIRTGNDHAESVSYNYMRGEFQGDKKKKASTMADLMPHNEFRRYASASLELVDSMDPDKRLSVGARKALALQIGKDLDANQGFNPYYYLGDIPGMSPGHTKEIHAVLKNYFGISSVDVSEYKSGTNSQRLRKMTNMGTSEGNERLNKTSATASNIRDNFPNSAERIDLLRATGNEQMLRDLGVITTQNGVDKIDMKVFHDRIGMYMDNPDNPYLRGISTKQHKRLPTRTDPLIIGARAADPKYNPYKRFNAVSEPPINQQSNQTQQSVNYPGLDLTPLNDGMRDLVESGKGILSKSSEMADRLAKLVVLAESGKLLSGSTQTPTEEKEEEKAKQSIIERLSSKFSFKGMGKGLGSLLSNNPMMLGGIVGAAGSTFFQDPIRGAAFAALSLGAGYAYDKIREHMGSSTSAGSEPSDDEDILNDRGEPILKSALLKARAYIDAGTKKVIKTWKDIKGPIYNTAEKTVIAVKDLAGKVFGPDGRAVALKGLQKVRDGIVNSYNFVDPLGKIQAALKFGKDLIYQQDVYVKGEDKPRLKANGFKSSSYYTRDESGSFSPISGWNEIKGAVFDENGNQLISTDEYNNGIVTSTGKTIGSAGRAGLSGLSSVTGKFGGAFNWVSGKFGGNIGGISLPGFSQNGVETRLDKIYRMLSQHFGIPIEEDGDIASTVGAAVKGEERLNSLSFKAKKAQEEEKHEVNKAIIEIAKNTKGMGEPEGDKKDESIWGKLKGMLFGLGSFAMKFIKNPIGAIGSLLIGTTINSTVRLAKIGTALFSGVLGIGSPIFKLLKFGFTKVAAALGGKAVDAAGNLLGGGRGNRRRSKGRARFGLGAKGLAGLAAGTIGAGFLNDALSPDDEDMDGSGDPGTYKNDRLTSGDRVSMGDRDPVTGHYRTTGDTITDALTDYLPQGALADTLVSGVIGSETKRRMDDMGLFWTSDGKFFFRRGEAEAYENKLRGIVSDQDLVPGFTVEEKPKLQKRIRYAMYGVGDPGNSIGARIQQLEFQLSKYVVIRENRASLKPDTPVEKLLADFVNGDTGKYSDKDAVMSWYVYRFKPVYMIYNAMIAVARMGDMSEFDKSKSSDVVLVTDKVQRTLATIQPHPYSIDQRIDSKVGLMSGKNTRELVSDLMDKLRKEYPNEKVEDKIATKEEAIVKMNETMASNVSMFPGNEMQNLMAQKALQASQEDIERRFKEPTNVKDINISDMMKGANVAMDPFTMVRLAAYGNVDNIPWRVEAVLKLERYMESYLMVAGDNVKFTGKTGQIFELFKASFRVDNDLASNNWSTWFRDRFLPVMMTYFKEVKNLRGVPPEKGWLGLTDTNKAVIARKLNDQKVTVDGVEKSVWEIKASPFPNSESASAGEKTNKYLAILDSKAQEARLKDPDMEDIKSRAVAEQKSTAQRDTSEKIAERTQKILDKVYGTGRVGGTTSGMGGTSGSSFPQQFTAPGMSQPYGAPGGGMGGGGAGSAGSYTGAANDTFNPEFIKIAGDDKGIKMTLQQGEQLMLNHLIKAGFRDKKVLALALAMAKKETGSYGATVENTNWNAQTLLKYFRNVPDAATAQKVAALSPVERAMWVYGRSPKGPTLGNTKPEDGWNYRGRGLFQLTGKANYEKFAKESGIDVVSNPRLVSEDPNVMAMSAVNFLKNNPAMLSIARTGNFDVAVRGINGGNPVPATDERRQFYNDYLNRLSSGDLKIEGGAPSSDGGMENDPMMQTLPTGADKGVDGSTLPVNSRPDQGKSVAELLNTGGSGGNIGATGASMASVPGPVQPLPETPTSGTPTSNPSALPQGTTSGTTTSTGETVNKSTENSVMQTPTQPKVTNTPQNNPPRQQQQAQSQSQGSNVGSGTVMTRDEAVAQLLQASNATLIQIARLLQSGNNNGNGLVSME